MAVSPIGNTIHINQNMPIAAAKQTDFQNRLEMQSAVATTAATKEEKEVEEVRPTEEAYKIDPEKEHEKKKNEQEAKEEEENSKGKNEGEKEPHQSASTHKLDILI